MQMLPFLASFGLICLSSKYFGQLFKKINLPIITGHLAIGVIAGPYILNIVSEQAVSTLKFIDHLSLAFIAFAAGAEFYLEEYRDRLKSIKWITFSVLISSMVIGGGGIYLLADHIFFLKDQPTHFVLAVSLIAGAILMARSPSSALAVVKETRARGPFTHTVIGVTVLSDLVVIIAFALNSSIAKALLTGADFNIKFLLLLFMDLSLSFVIGLCLGKVLEWIVLSRLGSKAKVLLIITIGYSVFLMASQVKEYTHHNFSFHILLEPLLICLIGGFRVANNELSRGNFLKVLHDIEPTIYLIFFTLTGATLNVPILGEIWPLTIAIFLIRIVSIYLGSLAGGIAAGNSSKINQLGWMGYITQAGIGLGLAAEVALGFPGWGKSFSTIMISVIVLNQIVGPIFFKWAVFWVKEAHPAAKKSDPNIVHNAVIFGTDGQALTLAKQLHSHHWQVKVAELESVSSNKVYSSDFQIITIADLSIEEFKTLDLQRAGTLITMLSEEENLKICELAYEHFGNANQIVYLPDRSNAGQFESLGAYVVTPSTAIISLLDHLVRSPSTASLLLGYEKDHDIIDVKIRNRNVIGMPFHHLRLPVNVIIVSVHRQNQLLSTKEIIRFQKDDVLTLIGPWEELDEVMDKLEEDF
jgi:Kef-type K+ transport system membrane component KefB/Trk K+ transport system NAD-binding subunit